MIRSCCADCPAGVAVTARTVALAGFVMIAFVGVAAGSFAAAMAERVMSKVLPRRFRPDSGEHSDPGF